MPGTDLRLLLAYDLRWFAPEDAKRVVQRARELGLIVEKDGVVHPAFDPARVDVPLNFRPTVGVLDEEGPVDLPPRASAPLATPAVGAPPQPPVPTAPVAPAPRAVTPAVPTAAAAPVSTVVQIPASPEASMARSLAEAERARRGNMLGIEAAALVVARRAGEDVSVRLAEAEARVLRG